jgi:hypothetical protein
VSDDVPMLGRKIGLNSVSVARYGPHYEITIVDNDGDYVAINGVSYTGWEEITSFIRYAVNKLKNDEATCERKPQDPPVSDV